MLVAIKISDYNGSPISTIKTLLDFQTVRNLSEGGKFSFTVPFDTTDIIDDSIFKPWNRVEFFTAANGSAFSFFTGFIWTIEPSYRYITIEGFDVVGSMDYRILRNGYDNAGALDNIGTVIQDVHNQINTNYPYPINLNIVGGTGVSSFAHPAGTTYLQFMQDTANLGTIGYEFGSAGFDLFFGVDIGNSLPGEFKYNQFNIASSNIVDWKSRISGDDISNYFVINDGTGPIFKDDVTSIATNGIFEKGIFEPQKDKALQPDLISLPKIYINPETEDWYSINPGDKKKVQIYTSKDWLNLDYISKIQSISVKGNGGKLDVAIEVADKSRAYLVRPTIPNILKNYLTRIRKIEVNQ